MVQSVNSSQTPFRVQQAQLEQARRADEGAVPPSAATTSLAASPPPALASWNGQSSFDRGVQAPAEPVLIARAQGAAARPSPHAPHDAKRHALGALRGAWGGLRDLAGGLVDMGRGAANLTGVNGEKARRETVQHLQRTAQHVIRNPRAVVDAVTRPITEPWKRGEYGEAIGRGAFEAAGIVVGTKGLEKLGRAGQVVRGLDAAGDAARAAAQASRAAEAGQVAARASTTARAAERGGEVARAAGAGARSAIAGLDSVAAREAMTGMRGGGGHAIRHLEEQGLIGNKGSLASRVEQARSVSEPILQSPTQRFPWRQGNTPGEIFLGEHNGRQVAVHRATEGPHAGKVTSIYAVDERNLAAWQHLMK